MSDAGECFRIAGSTVRVDWGDPALRATLRPALAHRAVEATSSELVITATSLAVAPGLAPPPGLRMSDTAEGLQIDEPERGLSHQLDAAGRVAVLACHDPRRLPVNERAAPFRLIFQRWLRLRGVHLLHAGAVGLPGRGAVLLVAPSGGGKSNTVLSCLVHSALQLLGEDYVAVDGAVPPRAWSVYGSAKLLAADLARFPGLADDLSAVRDEGDGKVALDLGQRHRARLGDGLPLRAILVLAITGNATSRVVPAPPGEAVKAMLTSLLMVLPAARRPLFEFTTALVRKLPAYRLELGRDPAQIAATIEEFIQA